MLAILKIRCTFVVQNKPKTKSLMKKFNVVLVGVAIAALTACGPSAAEKAEKARQDSIRIADSIAKVEAEKQRVADSIAMAEQAAKEKAIADSIAAAEANKKGGKKK
ncbi:MAG TPA: hypothetical protein PKE52_02760 [Bacteroidales bacterium]|jgi:hypothetical protein|nr:hypothetical protein [Bacteroidales bacterium]